MPGPTVHGGQQVYGSAAARRRRRQHQQALNQAARRARRTPVYKARRSGAKKQAPQFRKAAHAARVNSIIQAADSGFHIGPLKLPEINVDASAITKPSIPLPGPWGKKAPEGSYFQQKASPLDVALAAIPVPELKAAPGAAKAIPKIAEVLRGAEKAAPVAGKVERGSEAAIRAERAAQAAKAARAAEEAGRARRAARVVRHPVKATGRAAGRGVRAGARRAAKTRGGRAVVRASRSPAGDKAGRVAGHAYKVARPVVKAGTYPIRKPIRGAALVQAPAVATSGSTSPLGQTSLVGTVLNKVGTVAGGALPGAAGNIVKDAFNLPAVALPSVYLPLAGAVHAATHGGDTSQLDALLEQYKKSGLLPAVFRGDPKAALRAIEKHPLYSGLEVSGLYAGVGRGLGGAVRKGSLGHVGSTERAPLRIVGKTAQERAYSKNLITREVQKANEARQRAQGRDPNVATERQAGRYISGAKVEGHRRGAVGVIHRFIEQHELRRRENRTRILNEHGKAKPKKHRNVVAEAAQASLRHPATFREDVASRIRELDAEAASGNLTKAELELNRRLANDLEKASNASEKEIAAIFESARRYAVEHNLSTAAAVGKGLYEGSQVERSRLFPYVLRHMGGSHGIPEHVPRRLAEIAAEAKAVRQQAGAAERGAAGNVRLSRRRENIARSGQEQARVTAGRSRGAAKSAAAEETVQGRTLKVGQEAKIGGGWHRIEVVNRDALGRPQDYHVRAGGKWHVVHGDDPVNVRREARGTPRERAAATLAAARGRTKQAGQQVTGDIRNVRGAARERGAVEAGAGRIRELRAEMRAVKQTPEQLLDSRGRPLTTAQIHAHMRANGVDPATVGFLSHAPGITGSRSFNQRAHSRAQIARAKRTGANFRHGVYDASYEALAGQHAYTQGQVDRAATIDALIVDHGIRAPNGGYFRTRANAENVAAATGGNVPLVPMEITPWLSLRRELEAARKSGQSAATLDASLVDPVMQGFDKSLSAQNGRFVLVPETMVKSLQDHFKAANPLQRGASSITQAFKYTVLPTSDKWILGNVLDQGTRALFSGINPVPGASLLNLRVARPFLNRMEALHGKEARATIERQMVSGGHYSQRQNYHINQDAQGLAGAFHQLAQKPGAKQIAWTYGKYAKNVFRVNGWMERQMELAGLGKAIMDDVRRNNSSWESALTLQKGALDDLAHGLLNTDKQAAFAHQVEDIFGRWRGNSPTARALITGYAPFYLWARNASRFILLTLPTKHPIKVALIAAAATATEKERKKLGLDLFADKPLPGFLQGSLPGPIHVGPVNVPKGGLIPSQYYTSFGVFSNYTDFLGNIVLPQISGAIAASGGLSWNGERLTHPNGTPITDPRILAGLTLNSFAEGTVPFLSIARRTREGGGSSGSTSTILTPETTPGTKPGGSTLAGGAKRVYIPRTYDRSTVNFLRDLSQQQTISIPATTGGGGSSSGGSGWWDTGGGGSSSGGGGWWK